MNHFLARNRTAVLMLLFAAIGLALYGRVILQAEFLFDDFEYIVGNPIVDDISALLRNFSDPRQLGYLTFALNYLVGHESPVGYHLFNVAVHIVNACLVFLLAGSLLRLSGWRGEDDASDLLFLLPAGAGLLFLVHPLQTQAVSYVTQRFTSLATLFYLASIVLYLSARSSMLADPSKKRIPVRYWAALACAVAAMKTKEIAFTLPVALAVLETLFLGRTRERAHSIYLLLPFLATMAVIPLAILGPDWGLLDKGVGIAETTRTLKIEDLFTRSPLEYFATQTRVLVIYLRLLLFPYAQQAVYDINASRSLLELWVILSLALHLLLLYFATRMWQAARSPSPQAPFQRLFAVGIGWFYLTASVESSFLPIKDLIFEHRAYLPGIGIILAALSAGVLMCGIPGSSASSGRLKQAIGAVTLIAVILSAATMVRNNVWLNEMDFWEDVVKKVPNRAIGYHNRGNALVKAGRVEEAIDDISRTIAMFEPYIGKKLTWDTADYTPSNMSKTYMNRATIYEKLGDMARANADYAMAQRMMQLQSVDLEATKKLADAFYRKSAYKHAIEQYDKILAWFPNDLEALNDRGNAYSLSGNYEKAIADFDAVISRDRQSALAYYNRGVAHAGVGNKQKALADLKKGCAMGFEAACEGMAILEKRGR